MYKNELDKITNEANISIEGVEERVFAPDIDRSIKLSQIRLDRGPMEYTDFKKAI